jgi:integrase
MASGNITIRSVQALAPGASLWDAGHREAVRGFGVRRQRDAAVYVLKYRAGGRQRFYTIGTHGSPWTPERARKEAKLLLGVVASGKDPADAKAEAAQRNANTLRGIIDEYLKHARAKQKPKSYSETERYLLGAWKPLHPISIFSITRRQIAVGVGALAEEGGPVAARQARAALSALFNWAIREGYEIGANPVAGTNRPAKGPSRDRVLTEEEMRAIWRACADDDYGRIIRLLMLTGQRRDEIGAMTWGEVVGDELRIVGARTKNHRDHVVPLTPAALALLEGQPRRNDRPYVFGVGARGFCAWSRSKAALDARVGEGTAPWVVHDLRRTVATMLADRLGVLPHIIEAILNHISGARAGVAGIYNRARYAGEMREALERWAREVSRIVAGRCGAAARRDALTVSPARRRDAR